MSKRRVSGRTARILTSIQGLRIRWKYCGGCIPGGLQSIGVDADNRKAILLALAWIGDEKVVERFWEWQAHPPEWAGTPRPI
ncbi:hypothetical protein [Paenibacillus thiaminolyticus]|uniref:Uncharacterized protein n=1 Tax=Paenibacillus thiaminolyticus TaxID=49283 RepID=A0A3A3H4D7_PANTH|nr:hypothetical protein [Paenibacillus thiaminolyticus]RJG26563.1 hypothetical protein DQX05_00515 [Paenibacillus thiaminolyticus]